MKDERGKMKADRSERGTKSSFRAKGGLENEGQTSSGGLDARGQNSKFRGKTN